MHTSIHNPVNSLLSGLALSHEATWKQGLGLRDMASSLCHLFVTGWVPLHVFPSSCRMYPLGQEH